MKFYPYANINTQRLGILLFASRVAAVLGFVALLVGVVIILASLVAGGIASQDATFAVPSAVPAASVLIGLIASAGYGLGLLMVSGLCAAVVSLEHYFTNGP